LAVATIDPATRALIEALDEPAFVIERQVVRVANAPGRAFAGEAIEGSDVRLAIRHPQALEFVLSGKSGDIEFTGLGVGRPWRLSVQRLGGSTLLLRLIDRSAAHAAEKLRVDFVANASHELRTPLAAVLGYSESLKDEGLEPEVVAKFAGTIETEARRMLRIIEDLMSLSRIEADRFVAPTEAVDIGGVIESAIESARRNRGSRDFEIILDLQNDLPPIPGDFGQLAQLVDNLLGNAIRYGCADSNSKIRVSAKIDGQSVRLEVADNGPGIPREHLPFVTRRFYRVDAARSRDTGGTGLGLAIVKHIVERHCGELAIDSAPGKGTRVRVTLPLHSS
jgi:two-component system phosphate regulon sensor histidine kinase PhoR